MHYVTADEVKVKDTLFYCRTNRREDMKIHYIYNSCFFI